MPSRLSTTPRHSVSASFRAQRVKVYEMYRSKHCLEGKQGIPTRTLRPPWPVQWKPQPGDHTLMPLGSLRGRRGAESGLTKTFSRDGGRRCGGWERPGHGEQQPVVAASPLWLHHVFTLVIAKTWWISVLFFSCLFSPGDDSTGLMKVACYFICEYCTVLCLWCSCEEGKEKITSER